MPSDESALSEVEFIDNYNLCFAGKYGITVYNLASKETVWTGNKATSISVSSDGINVAGIYKDENTATIYDSQTGNILQTVDLTEEVNKLRLMIYLQIQMIISLK